MKIRDIMSKGCDFCAPDTPVGDIARRMRDRGVGAVPVADNDKLVGMVTDRDIVLRAVADGSKCEARPARTVMSEKVLYCIDEDGPAEVLESMRKSQVRRLPVVDGDKKLVGMVTLGDIARHVEHEESGKALAGISAADAAG